MKKMKRLGLLLAMLLVISPIAIPAIAAVTEDEIEASINKGVVWLAGQQNPDGSWGYGWAQVARTGFAVVKLADRAIELRYKSPFDPAYPYAGNVEKGLNYIFANAHTMPISVQPAGNPDTNGNGVGIYFGGQRTYETGIAMMAIAASRGPNRLVVSGPLAGKTYEQVLQDAVDYLAFGQNDYPTGQGGWGYEENDQWQQWGEPGRTAAGEPLPPAPGEPVPPEPVPPEPGTWYSRSDNSNSGYAVLGLCYSETNYNFNCTVPQFVKNELSTWIDYIQNDIGPVGDPNDGGSGYDNPEGWVNILKTGNLLFEMEFVGDTAATPRVLDAINYIVRHWNDGSSDPGWRGWPGNPAHKQAMYCAMKGLEVLGLDTINSIDWYADFADVLVAQQKLDGSWDWDQWGDNLLGTEWALLTLEKVVPPLKVVIDIKPGSFPNSINLGSSGVIPVAILTTSAAAGEPVTFDACTVDPTTVRFGPAGAAAVQWAPEYVDSDGDIDMILHFKTQETGITVGDTEATLTGETFDGREFSGTDSVQIVPPAGKGKSGK